MDSPRVTEILARLQELNTEQQRLMVELDLELKRAARHTPPTEQKPTAPAAQPTMRIVLHRERQDADEIMMIRRRGDQWVKSRAAPGLDEEYVDKLMTVINDGHYIDRGGSTSRGRDTRFVYLVAPRQS